MAGLFQPVDPPIPRPAPVHVAHPVFLVGNAPPGKPQPNPDTFPMSTDLLPQDDGLAVTGSGLRFTTPLADLLEFSDLPEKRRTEVRVLLPLLERVHAMLGARSLQAACEIVAAGSRHLMRGLSKESLRRKYEAFRDSAEGEFPAGNWRVLVAGYRGPSKQPREFQAEVKRVSQVNNCSVAEALQQLRERWSAGEAIAGYGNWMEYYQLTFPLRALPRVWPRGFYPQGWSPRNLRRYGSPKNGRVLAQRGLAAAKKHFPSVTRDPSQLRPLELIVMDDFELDCFCVFPGACVVDGTVIPPQVGRVAGLLAMDVATRKKLHWVMGQRLERDERQADGTMRTVKSGIARCDVLTFLHGLFEKTGLPDYPVTILCEMDRAAASISKEQELSIATLFGGRVRVERTGILSFRGLENGFCERGGRPWIKGWIEAAFAQLWNMLGGHKGYKGSNMRLNAPGDIEARIAYTKLLIGRGAGAENLPTEIVAKLRLPFENPQQLERAFAWACALSDTRTNHRYVGFDQVTEYLLEEGTEPVPFTALALLPEQQMLQAKPLTRIESSVERWERLARPVTFTAIDRAVLAVFLLTPKRVTYRNAALTFRHGTTGYSYVDKEGTVLRDIPEGTDFLCYLNPDAPEVLHITQLNGSRTGTLYRLGGKTGMVDIRDKAALAEAGAVQAQIINRVVAENRALHADKGTLEQAEREHNEQVVVAHRAATEGLTVAQKIALAAGEAAGQAAAADHDRKSLARALQKRVDAIDDATAKEFLAAEAAPATAPQTHSPAGDSLGDYL